MAAEGTPSGMSRPMSTSLQRGRGAMAAEGSLHAILDYLRLAASTRPRRDGRGRAEPVPLASRAELLQRGRGAMAAEGCHRWFVSTVMIVLQRGRGAMAAEVTWTPTS